MGKPLPEPEVWPIGPLADEASWWTVLRCHSGATLDLAQELREERCIAWSPISYEARRLPRIRKRVQRVRALVPSFVFVGAQDADRAIALSFHGRVNPCRLFVVNGHRAHIPVEELMALEREQAKSVVQVRSFRIGQGVEVIEGLLKYERGTIVKALPRHQYAVEFGNRLEIVLPGFLLRSVG